MLDWLFNALGLKPRQATEAHEKRDDGFVPMLIVPAGPKSDASESDNCGGDAGSADGGAGDGGGGGGDGC